MNRMLKLLAVLVAPLVLTSCFFLPGKFDATMRLMQGGDYQFTYVGEMQILAGDEKDMKKPVLEPFNPKNAQCNDWVEEDGSTRPNIYYDRYADNIKSVADIASEEFPKRVARSCTKEELAELEKQEKTSFERREKDYEQRSGMVAMMFGGAVPGNDEALAEFANTLMKYDGWEKVEYVGDNLFNVEYRANGNFDRYFAFPVLNDASMQYPFFQIVPRKTGELELLAPGIAGKGGLMGMAMLGGFPGGGNKDMPMKPIEGSFTLETDGEVLGNNSPDGYETVGGNKVIRWNVKDLAESPRALIKID